jgi:hypothetical protein
MAASLCSSTPIYRRPPEIAETICERLMDGEDGAAVVVHAHVERLDVLRVVMYVGMQLDERACRMG